MRFGRDFFLIGIGVWMVFIAQAIGPMRINQTFWLLCGGEPKGINPYLGLSMFILIILIISFLINVIIKKKKFAKSQKGVQK